ncbi:MAG TPA: class II aldolase/adducin family protein [Microthrixaceae bacterium]|mgnify:CR=1 FL=1|nr:class II aldolase/adducin family protein [Microthrixaceae bacterium]HMT23391.1 class II aldolase/adducin family protein [Microthrixaceae bacterium]HMT62811.1 class II aldolase/adducin family protein [Microthrixaceae bacterium]
MTERPARPPAPFRFADDAPSSEVRRHRKQRLAAAFRLFGRFGFDEGVAGHITARDPELTDHFWVNPFGLSFRQIRVSDLILVDHDGRVVEGDWPVNRAALAIHSQLHQARPDIVAAAHSHSRFGRALSALDTRIEPITQDSCAFFEDHARFDDYTGVVDETDEGRRIAEALGGAKAAILANHGLLTVGGSVESAVWWYITMERTAEVQLAATSAGSPVPIRPDVARRTREMVGSEAAGQFQFHPLWNWIVAEEPDLLD